MNENNRYREEEKELEENLQEEVVEETVEDNKKETKVEKNKKYLAIIIFLLYIYL